MFRPRVLNVISANWASSNLVWNSVKQYNVSEECPHFFSFGWIWTKNPVYGTLGFLFLLPLMSFPLPNITPVALINKYTIFFSSSRGECSLAELLCQLPLANSSRLLHLQLLNNQFGKVFTFFYGCKNVLIWSKGTFMNRLRFGIASA
jgi:hypothetical protein